MSEEDPIISFEKKIEELELLVSRMEEGDMTLDETMKSYERGISLTRSCQKALNEAENKVDILSKDMEVKPYDGDV